MNDVPSICTNFDESISHIQLRPLPPTPPPTMGEINIRKEQLVLDTALLHQFSRFQQYVDAAFRSIERQIDGLDFRIHMIEYQLVKNAKG